MDAGQLVRELCVWSVLGVLWDSRADSPQALWCQIMSLSCGWKGGDLVPNMLRSGSVMVFDPVSPLLLVVSIFIITMV